METPEAGLIQPAPIPTIEEPYILGTNVVGALGQVIPAGRVNFPLPLADFSHSLEWPLKVRRIKFVNDDAHTFKQWKVRVVDQTFNQEWMKQPVLVEALIQVDTGFWELARPWIIRSQGGGQNWFVDNLDPVNPITVAILLHGTLEIPDRGR